MPLELIMLRSDATANRWPVLLSVAVGIFILLLINLMRKPGRLDKWLPSLFVLNAASISLAFYLADMREIPFQASKLGVIVVAMLAPSFLSGILSIALHSASTLVPFSELTPPLREAYSLEPWPTLGFAVASLFVLAHRIRIRLLQARMLEKTAEVEATQRLAQSFLELRDSMNTPIQSIEIATSLLSKRNPNYDEILEELKRSTERLAEISSSLKRYEHAVQWKNHNPKR